ncbi:MerR family transcriptional regulator [Halalkalibacter krulwichiae]|uniref:HTH merR-type domain-containing protein n=1 Tax=Halalkalibacter krulwichiae TaxID=199441 RepID=A0A1X9M9G1_9BACI|nr:MerR family transcriptional regulator [Halalkalibacter krulwichiae]ARK30099.1 hypothetical protein BkAM31D_09660 [Halalkalibacter krulwichiae]
MSNVMFIGEFSTALGLPTNTLESWVKRLEEHKLHFVNKDPVTNKRVYDEEDLKVFMYIKDQRKKDVPFHVIYKQISKEVQLRYEVVEDLVDDEEEIKSQLELFKMQLCYQVQDTLEDVLTERLIDFNKTVKGFIQELLEKELVKQELNVDHMQQELRVKIQRARLEEFITIHRYIAELEEHALYKWNNKPESERLKKVGWFKKAEDVEARNEFVKAYVNQYLGACIKKGLTCQRINEKGRGARF